MSKSAKQQEVLGTMLACGGEGGMEPKVEKRAEDMSPRTPESDIPHSGGRGGGGGGVGLPAGHKDAWHSICRCYCRYKLTSNSAPPAIFSKVHFNNKCFV